MKFLAGDIGGTNTRLALLEDSGKTLRHVQTFPSKNYPNLTTIAQEFLGDVAPDIACFGIAGPIEGTICRATNLPWVIDTHVLEEEIGAERVYLINDLVANAYGISSLHEKEDFRVLNTGETIQGNQALISPGTGLGEAGMVRIRGHLYPFASEGGHVDFAPIDDLQDELLDFLRRKFSEHISYERVLSGPGMENIYNFLIEEKKRERKVLPKRDSKLAKHITRHAMERACPCCEETVDIFLSIYGSAAGNLALKFLAFSGIFLGGGIVPHIVPLLENGIFMRSFLTKGRFSSLLEKIPVHILLNDRTALFGALAYAKEKHLDA